MRTKRTKLHYVLTCDYHPKRKSLFSFEDERTGEMWGLCKSCFADEVRRTQPARRRNRRKK